ncbi:hypothetical protein ACIQ7S_03640 [Streptomyces griseoluteus]
MGERVIRTEGDNAAKLEREHTKAVKAAVIELRRAALPDSMPDELRDKLTRRVNSPRCNWVDARKPLRPLPARPLGKYMREESPGHWVEL